MEELAAATTLLMIEVPAADCVATLDKIQVPDEPLELGAAETLEKEAG